MSHGGDAGRDRAGHARRGAGVDQGVQRGRARQRAVLRREGGARGRRVGRARRGARAAAERRQLCGAVARVRLSVGLAVT